MLKAFATAVTIGTLVGAAVPLVATCVLAIGMYSGNPLVSLLIMVAPLAVTATVVLVASLLVGLPLTALLVRRNAESAEAYLIVGVLVGALIPFGLLVLTGGQDPYWRGGIWLSLLGAVSGGATAKSWWNSRRKLNSDAIAPGAIFTEENKKRGSRSAPG